LLIRKIFLLVAIILMLPSSVIGMDDNFLLKQQITNRRLSSQDRQSNAYEALVDMEHPSDQTLTSQMNAEQKLVESDDEFYFKAGVCCGCLASFGSCWGVALFCLSELCKIPRPFH
jgi:hypothetical protein